MERKIEDKRLLEKIEKLKKEQEEFSKFVKLEDKFDFNALDKVGGVACISKRNLIICGIVVIKEKQIIEQKYSFKKAEFPYISGFKAYRELPVIMNTFNLLNERPDLFFINASGVCHPRKFGLASHFSLATQIPVIGICENLLYGKEIENKIYINKMVVGEKILTKEGAKPIYVCPGNFISVESAVELTKRFVEKPHKLPEPLRLAKKYVKKILKEILR